MSSKISPALRVIDLAIDLGPVPSLDRRSTAALHRTVSDAVEDPDVQVLVVRSSGRAWCVGGDIPAFHAAGEQVDALIHEIGSWINPIITLLYETPKITIGEVNGAVAGGGIGLLAALDVIIASESTIFGLGYKRLGVNPDAGATWLLPRRMGYHAALHWYLTDARLSAQEAADLGLISEVLPSAEACTNRVTALASELGNGRPAVYRDAKLLFRAAAQASLADQAATEIKLFAEHTNHAHFRDAVESFVGERAAAKQPR